MPTFRLLPPDAADASTDDGSDCVALAEAYGLTLDPWQAGVVTDWLRTDPTGHLLATDAVVVLPRQNGKNALTEAVELFKTAVQGRRVLHTAHEVKTARRHFMRMQDYFDSDEYPELKAAVKAIRQTNGQEAVLLKNGGRIEFIARSKSSGRGFTCDDLVLDEAQELTDEQLEALRPVISAAPSGDPQTIYMGTPTPPTSPGTVLVRMYKAAHSDTPPQRLAWLEWAVDAVGDVQGYQAARGDGRGRGDELQPRILRPRALGLVGRAYGLGQRFSSVRLVGLCHYHPADGRVCRVCGKIRLRWKPCRACRLPPPR